MRGPFAVVALCWLFPIACVQPGAVTCGDGRVCPADHVCDDVHGGCASNEQLRACEGKAQLDGCTYVGVDDALCLDGVCLPTHCGDGVIQTQNDEICDEALENSDEPGAMCRTNCQLARCGDAIVDPGEACDDGNTNSTDRCSFDCLSNETCGNGYVDFLVGGELCDDGNQLNHDGCGSCQPEPPAWQLVDRSSAGSALPERRQWSPLAYDAARGRIVMFAGEVNSPLLSTETWEWNGTAWALKVPRTGSPPARRGHSLTYDSKRHRVIMFGGYGADNAFFDDTWEWNGTVWTNISPATGNPPSRDRATLAYDAARDRVVLFGGLGGDGSVRSDTWEWNGTAWKNVTPAGVTNPPGRVSAAAAYDPVRGRVVLFGGITGPTFLADTWEWNGTAWSDVTPTSSNPDGRADHALVFDAASGRVVMHGGYNGAALAETLEWNGTSWTAVSSGPPRRAHGMAFDLSRRRMVLFGGNVSSTNLSDTWERDGTTWTEVTPTPTRPGFRQGSGMAYDSARGRMVLFGGNAGTKSGETWEWGNESWKLISAGGSGGEPTARDWMGMVYDVAHAQIVLFGGSDGSGARNDTWVYNGSSWSNVTPASGNPPARYEHSMAYDSARQRVVMFGGRDSGAFADTWEWNGSSWTEVTPATGSPVARWTHSMTYDVRRGRVVMFGGWNGISTTERNDTWEWTGTSWTEIMPQSTSPLSRHYPTLAYDSTRGRVMLFGGYRGSVYMNDLWSWDGTAWVNIALSTRPSARYGSAFAYDIARSELVLFSGQTGFQNTDTYTLRYDSEEPSEGCYYGLDGDHDELIGCADPDCYGVCSPLCNPTLATCTATGPRCGDGVCQPIESSRVCPADCTSAPSKMCGDYICELPEASTSCPGDCGA